MLINIFSLFASILLLLIIPARDLDASKVNSKEIQPIQENLIQIRVTYQDPNFLSPWRTKSPSTRVALGIYVGKQKILMPASHLLNQTFIEVRTNADPIPKQGNVVSIDYEADLALIEISKPGNLFRGMKVISLFGGHAVRENVKILSLDSNGEIISKTGQVGNLTMGHYPQGRIELPNLELLSNEKMAGMGEIVVSQKSDQIVGILHEFQSNQGQGKITPSPLIQHFLSEGEGLPYKGFFFRPLNDVNTSEYYGIHEEGKGILVAEVLLGSSADGILKTEDVIYKIGNFDIDGKGRFDHPKYGKIPFTYLIHAGLEFGYNLGKSIPMEVIRDKKVKKISFPLKPYPEIAIKIPHGSSRNIQPGYMISGGFVFLELSEFYLEEWGHNWRSTVDKKMLYLLDYHKYRKSVKDEKRIVYLSQILPDDANNGYHEIRQVRVVSLNGNRIDSLEDMFKRIQSLKPADMVHWILEDGMEFAIQKSELAEVDKRIQSNFKIPQLYMIPTINSKSDGVKVEK
ncbi:PDZ domain-containing protein [Leptospira sp. GIMC2001]|uniref:PDZ domain-containing protein n=1 Tax=Leptospira sp. GIMC2001 TaxID=1513297 RepID=UPI00234A8A64|nr:serine protease [Leptospira sp. GIMC2001]WCL47564.1 serine protease [Leptospira sp. GIMC2001]